MTARSRRSALALLAVLLLAFALRLWGLSDHNIWWDEGLAAWAARLPIDGIIEWTAHDVHPPLYFILLAGWWRLAGDGEFALRAFSVLTGVVAVAGLYGLANTVLGRRAGLLSALFLAISVFAVSWSQEMRMYCLASALAVGALWSAFQFAQTGSRRAALCHALLVAAGLWTLYLFIIVPIAANLGYAVLWLKRGRPRREGALWLGSQALAAGLFLPWLIHAVTRMPTWSSSEAFDPLTFLQLYASMLTTGISTNLDAYGLWTLAGMVVFALALFALWRAKVGRAQRSAILALLVGVGLPALIVYLVSLPIHLFYAPRLAPRYLLPLAPCFYALLGMGIAHLWQRHRAIGLAATLVIVLTSARGTAEVLAPRIRTDDYLTLSSILTAQRFESDSLILHSDRDWPLLAAHYPGAWSGVPYGAPVDAGGALSALPRQWGEGEGVWLISTPDAQRVDPQARIRMWLSERAVMSRTWSLGDNVLQFFARTPERAARLDAFATPALAGQLSPVLGLSEARLPLDRYARGDTVRLSLSWVRAHVPLTLQLNGPATRAWVLPASMQPREVVNIPLSPDLPTGRYELTLGSESARVRLAAIEIVAAVPRATVSEADIPKRIGRTLGADIELVGYRLETPRLRAGESVAVTLFWRARNPVSARFKVFTHVMGTQWNAARNNPLWGQVDAEPMGGLAPTTTWLPGEIIADSYRIPLDADAPAGRYTLVVGLYGLLDGGRLPVSGGGDAITLSDIDVVR